MSRKNKGGGNDFQNYAARLFKRIEKVDLLSQEEIFNTLDAEMQIILDQVTAHRNHDRGAQFPDYVLNGFANLSTTLYFKRFVKKHVKVTKKNKIKTDLSEDSIQSLRQILADAYKKSATNFYGQQTDEFIDRSKMLAGAFVMLDPVNYALTKKLKLKKSQRRDLCIQIFGDPIYNMKYIHKLLNESPLPDKKKLKLLRKMYGKKRFIAAVGAAMTLDNNNSDGLAMLIGYVTSMKKKKRRAPYLMAYAVAYKKNKTYNFRLADGEFYKKNKPLIKELKKVDIGFKKAFKHLKPGQKGPKKPKPEKKEKKENRIKTKETGK